ncbi:MAG TPA: hypothetical protein VF813_00035, partial [Anaerolineaceae bacterium]
IWWLNRRLPGRFEWGGTLLRTCGGTLAAGLLMTLLMRAAMVPQAVLAVLAACIGGLAALPFIWREMRLLIRL